MSAIVIGTFLVLAGAAAAFAVWPVLRWKDRLLPQRALAGAAAALFILGVGVGTYLMIGSPSLAVRDLSEPSTDDLPGLVAALAQRVRERPRDVMGWTLLGRGYLTLNDPNDAAS